jgi:hypothetical protein
MDHQVRQLNGMEEGADISGETLQRIENAKGIQGGGSGKP